MKFHDKLFFGVGAALLGLGAFGVAAAQEPAAEPEREAEVVKARLVTARPGHRAVHDVRLLKAGGGRLDWSRQGDRLAFDQAGPDGLYDVYLMSAEGTAETCLTCEQCEVRCPEHVKIPEILVLAKVRGLASGNTPQTALDRARAILSEGRVINVSESMLKTRDKMGLPSLGTPPTQQLIRILKELGTAERVESAESTYGGAGDE